jgi:hypothetical protein
MILQSETPDKPYALVTNWEDLEKNLYQRAADYNNLYTS